MCAVVLILMIPYNKTILINTPLKKLKRIRNEERFEMLLKISLGLQVYTKLQPNCGGLLDPTLVGKSVCMIIKNSTLI